MIKFILYLFGVLFILAFTACTNNTNQEKNNSSNTVTDTLLENKKDTLDTFSQLKYNMAISNIPFPFEMLEELNTLQIPYNQKVMNPVSNVSKYSQSNSKAFNLGIYGADLAYSVTFEQFQQIGTYVKNTKKLAEDLNIPLAFNQEMMDKYTKFKDNKDSLAKVVFDSYTTVDKTLKSNERIGIADLVVAGSWLEGLYLTTKTVSDVPKNADNAGLYKTILGQKLHLENIIQLLNKFQNEDFFVNLIRDLTSIKSVYDNLAKPNEISEDELIILNQKIEKLRKKIIEGV